MDETIPIIVTDLFQYFFRDGHETLLYKLLKLYKSNYNINLVHKIFSSTESTLLIL
jgi:hypothetical protein